MSMANDIHLYPIRNFVLHGDRIARNVRLIQLIGILYSFQ